LRENERGHIGHVVKAKQENTQVNQAYRGGDYPGSTTPCYQRCQPALVKKRQQKYRRRAQAELSRIHEVLERVWHEKQQNRSNQEHRGPKHFAYQKALRAEEEHSEETG
jgi:hypothetical protein